MKQLDNGLIEEFGELVHFFCGECGKTMIIVNNFLTKDCECKHLYNLHICYSNPEKVREFSKDEIEKLKDESFRQFELHRNT